MHEFPTLDDTESSLNALSARSPNPLVIKLPRQPGMKEQRYAHLLSGDVPTQPAEATTAGPPAQPEESRVGKLESETASLRAEVAELRQQLADLRKQLE
jgi:hypothetical protein